MLTTVLDLLGYALITIAAFLLFGVGVGVAVGGGCVLVISWKLA